MTNSKEGTGEPCARCGGTKEIDVPAEATPDGERVVRFTTEPCKHCQGTGAEPQTGAVEHIWDSDKPFGAKCTVCGEYFTHRPSPCAGSPAAVEALEPEATHRITEATLLSGEKVVRLEPCAATGHIDPPIKGICGKCGQEYKAGGDVDAAFLAWMGKEHSGDQWAREAFKAGWTARGEGNE